MDFIWCCLHTWWYVVLIILLPTVLMQNAVRWVSRYGKQGAFDVIIKGWRTGWRYLSIFYIYAQRNTTRQVRLEVLCYFLSLVSLHLSSDTVLLSVFQLISLFGVSSGLKKHRTRTQSETADLRQRYVVCQVAAPYSVWQRFPLCPIESNVNENFKVIQNPGFLPDHPQNLITGSFCRSRHSQKISERSNFLSYLADTQTNKQTNKQTNEVWQKHYLLGGGNW